VVLVPLPKSMVHRRQMSKLIERLDNVTDAGRPAQARCPKFSGLAGSTLKTEALAAHSTYPPNRRPFGPFLLPSLLFLLSSALPSFS
jgi:hypothetical protein